MSFAGGVPYSTSFAREGTPTFANSYASQPTAAGMQYDRTYAGQGQNGQQYAPESGAPLLPDQAGQQYVPNPGGSLGACGCGGGKHPCLESDETRSVIWSYVGKGCGGYEPVQAYSYCGEGAGSWDRVVIESSSGYRCRKCCIALLILSILGALLSLLAYTLLSQSRWGDTSMDVSQVEITTAGMYDCNAGYANWESTWPVRKKQYCCRHERKGCPSNPCDARCTYKSWTASCSARVQWAADHQFERKLDSCGLAHSLVLSQCDDCAACRPVSTGCRPPPRTTAIPYNCNAGYSHWEVAWTIGKKAFCCIHSHHGCPTPPPQITNLPPPPVVPAPPPPPPGPRPVVPPPATKPDSPPYCTDCDGANCKPGMCFFDAGGTGSYVRTAAPASKFHLCDGMCSWKLTSSTGAPGQGQANVCDRVCDLGTGNRNTCGERIRSTAATAFEGQPDACQASLLKVLQECDVCHACSLADSGCTVVTTTVLSTTSAPYDCDAGFSNYENGWSLGKKVWCCQRTHKGCPSTTTSAPYDCEAGFDNWQKGWSAGKKAWCCSHRKRGCEETSTTLPYDCDAGYSNWRRGWSLAKKDWCCMNKQKGCPLTTSTSLPYDCLAGYSNWREGWSLSKKNWCCKNRHRGCGVSTTQKPLYDCRAGYPKCDAGWSEQKKEWCRDHGMGCFDCKAGYSNCQHGWSVMKKSACKKMAVACPAATTQPFNCEAGVSNWNKGWSRPKKEWCCAHVDKGCEKASADVVA